jgi:hypothetical protein
MRRKEISPNTTQSPSFRRFAYERFTPLAGCLGGILAGMSNRGGGNRQDWGSEEGWQPQPYLQASKLSPGPAVFGSLAVVIAALLVASVVGAFVVGGASKPTPAARLAAANMKTAHAGTAHFTSTVSLSAPANFTFSFSGESDFAKKSTEMHLSTNGISETVRLVNGVEYFQSALLSLPNGAHWVKILPQDVGLGSAPASAASDDPTQGLQFLGGIVGSPTVIGKAVVNGVSTTHYHVILNLKSLFARVGQAEGSLSPALGDGFAALAGQVDLTRIPGDVWLDSAGRVSRFSYSLNFHAGGQAISEVDTTNYSDFGSPVQVIVPAASDTVPFSAVKSQLSSGPSGLTA